MKNDLVWKFDYKSEIDQSKSSTSRKSPSASSSFDWESHEFILLDKSSKWFMLLGIASALLLTIIFIITRSYMSTLVTAAICGSIAYYAKKSPEIRKYHIDIESLVVDQKKYLLSDFRSYSYLSANGTVRYYFYHLKKILPPVCAYSKQDEMISINSIVGQVLPLTEGKNDWIDNLSQRFRF